MKTLLQHFQHFRAASLRQWLSVFLALAAGLPVARAGLTIDVHLYDNYGYFAYGFLGSNPNQPAFPVGVYTITSPQFPTNGTSLQYQSADGTNLDFLGGGGTAANDPGTFLNGLTNGVWTILVSNVTTTVTDLYTFTVTATSLDTNFLTPVTITFPMDGSTNVTTLPSFAWTGPSSWDGTLGVSDLTFTNGIGYSQANANLPSTQTSWQSTAVLPYGTNSFTADYVSNATGMVVASTPVDAMLNQIPGWVSTATLETYSSANFVVGSPPASPTSATHQLVAHYAFDTTDIGLDTSGNGNNLEGVSSWGSPVQQFSANAIAGGGAAQFFGESSMATGGTQLITNLVNAISGSFTVSLWLNTADSVGQDNDSVLNGAPIIWDFNEFDGVVPIAVTGSKAAFYTGDSNGVGDTLYSATSVNTGSYTHVVVTRDQTTGIKRLYVNGALDSYDVGTTDLLDGDLYYFSIGGIPSANYTGLLDDVQIYSGVLSDAEVAAIYNNPGSTAPNKSAYSPIAHWDFDEGTVLAVDVSSNGNNIVFAGDFGGNDPVTNSDAIAGSGSVEFDGNAFLTAPSSLLSTLAGTFSVSLWVNTYQDQGDPGDQYDFLGDGAGIITADVPGVANDLVPVALTGGQIGFNTGGTEDDTLYSPTYICDGNWHHVVVTRDQPSGTKQIFIDGNLDISGVATTNLLNAPQLLVIGAIADSSNPDPTSPESTGYNGYDGLLDDIQVYGRVLSSAEVSYLYNNPGTPIPPTGLNVTLPPVTLEMQFSIQRQQDPNDGDEFLAFPSFVSVSPTVITTNSIQSPNGIFSTEQTPNSGSSSSEILSSLSQVLNECTNGNWTIVINKGDVTQQTFTFTMTLSGVTTNILAPVVILFPTNGSVNVTTNPVFSWVAQTGFSSLDVYDYVFNGQNEGSSNLVATAESWSAPQPLLGGTNGFNVAYTSNDNSGIGFSTPMDAFNHPISSFTADLVLNTGAGAQFVVTPPPEPAQLINIFEAGGVLQFQFLSESGVTNSVESTTNLTTPNWQPRGDVYGDGTLKTLQFPATNRPAEFFRILTHN